MFPHLWHGTLREHYLVLFSVAGFIALVAGFVAAWIGAHFGARRAAQAAAEEALRTVGARSDHRLALLQQSVDTMAVELERVAEAQRFAAMRLAERPESRTELPVPAAPRPAARIPTPH